jgi:hypothetical protein
MSAPALRSYRVSLADGFAVWITAESCHAAGLLAERLWSETRSTVAPAGAGFECVEILDVYEEGGAP